MFNNNCFVYPVPELTMEEKQALVNRDDFVRFIDRSTRIMERAISENVDIFFDYSGADDEQEDRLGGHLVTGVML